MKTRIPEFLAIRHLFLVGGIGNLLGISGFSVLLIAFGFSRPDNFEHYFMLGSLFVVLWFVEWALARRFSTHEITEFAQRQELLQQATKEVQRAMMVWDSAGTASMHAAKQLNEALSELSAIKASAEQIASLPGRVVRLEVQVEDLIKKVDDIDRWKARVVVKARQAHSG